MTVYQLAKYVIIVAIIIVAVATVLTLVAAVKTKKKVLVLTVMAEVIAIVCLYVLHLMIAIGQYKTVDIREEQVETADASEKQGFEVTSTDLNDGVWDDVISNTDRGENLSPQLSWSEAEGAKVYVAYMIDPDGGNWVHMKAVSYDTDLDRGEVRNELKTEYIEPGYIGPYPPSGTHKYEVYVFALKEEKDRYPGVLDKPSDGIEKIMEKLDVFENGDTGNIITSGKTVGTFTH